MDVGKAGQNKGILEGKVPNKPHSMLLLASIHTKNDKTGIHEQMFQRMGYFHVAR